MPCGGIAFCGRPPETETWINGQQPFCHHCGGHDSEDNPLDHAVEEWDGMLHGQCVLQFLKTSEGRCVQKHGHEISLYGHVLQPEWP